MKRSFLKHKYHLFLIGFIFLSSSLHATNKNKYSQNSVLATGNWYKIKIGATGVYKLTYNDLKKMGLSSPQNVRIFGYGGGILDENFSDSSYVDDLPQVAIWMSNTPAKFGAGDYILFYGHGDINWSYNATANEFEQTQDPYSFDSYYFVTESAAGPKVMQSTDAQPITNAQTVNKFNDYYLHENELINISQTGREFYGEDFMANPSQDFNFSLTGITSDPATISYDFIAKPTSYSSKFASYINGSAINTSTIAVSSDEYQMANDLYVSTKNNLSETNKLSFKYTPGSTSDQNARLNYFRINYTRTLQPYDAVTLFRSTNLQSQLNFSITNANSNMLVFDVTNDTIPSVINGLLTGANLVFGADNSTMKEYALVDLSKKIPSPTLVGNVPNQNLHALSSADMVIIVQPYLQSYAESLAQAHFAKSGLTSIIVNPNDIYNEFSSGKPDMTAYRRFLKMFYDRAGGSVSNMPKSVLLFGDGSYDNRFINNAWNQVETRGMLLTYQSVNSLSETSSYTSDDYIGFLDDNSGINLTQDTLSIAVGRLPVRTQADAAGVINKIQNYLTNGNKGMWQNNITYLADAAIAGTNSSLIERQNMVNTDSLANYMERTHPEFTSSKIYEDAFDRVVTASGARFPDAHNALLNKISDGTLVLNYVGHGSTTAWSNEYVLTYPDIEAMSNSNQALWITATCDFSRYDADATAAGVEALLNPNGGAMGLFSTVRVVYSGQNKTLNQAIFNHLFDKNTDGSPISLGQIMLRGKNEIGTDDNKLRFALLGDPALSLDYPTDYRVQVTKINGINSATDSIQIKALSNTTVQGQIVDSNGAIVPNFNGSLQSLVFDSEQELTTHGYDFDNGGNPNPAIALTYKDFTNTIFSGVTKVVNGLFELNFVTPKDILYTNGYGKMNFLAVDSITDKTAQGAFTNYIVGGTDSTAVQDNTPPIISNLYLNTSQFKSGDVVNSTPLFCAHVSDDTGINLSSAIGHNISLTIDGTLNYNLTPSFVNDGLSAKSGNVQYLIPTLSDGAHTLQFKVWDVWNNSASQTINFITSKNYKPTIYKFLIGGNPGRETVRFIFNSDTPKSTVNIRFDVYAMTGALCWTHQESGAASQFQNYTYDWNLVGTNGSRLQAGVYICRLSVSFDGSASTKTAKLIVLEQ